MSDAVIKVEGLRDLDRALRQFGDRTLPRQLRAASKAAAQVVSSEASRRVPHRSGRLAASIRAAGTQRGALVRAGGARVPYAGWIEFGGTVRFKSRNGKITRPFVQQGRYIRPAARDKERQVIAEFERGVNVATRQFR